MQFDKDHKVIPETLTVEEAPTFIKFLEDEVERHRGNITASEDRIRLENSAVRRHQEDIDETLDLISRIRKEKLGE